MGPNTVTNLPEGADAGIRMSNVDGFTVVRRNGRRPKIHLLRPWNECNTTRGKSGDDTVRVKGGREHLMTTLGEMGYRRGGVDCRRCFPYAVDDDVETPVLEMGDTGGFETVDKYDNEVRTRGSEVLAEL